MVLMLMTDVYINLSPSVAQAFVNGRNEMMVSWELKPGRVESACWRKPRIHDNDDVIGLSYESSMPEVCDPHRHVTPVTIDTVMAYRPALLNVTERLPGFPVASLDAMIVRRCAASNVLRSRHGQCRFRLPSRHVETPRNSSRISVRPECLPGQAGCCETWSE